MEEQGYFIFSLDTELATGYFDHDGTRHKIFSPDGSRERKTILRLIELFEEFNIVGTWAIVGHLFYDACEDCEICPIKEWSGNYSSFDEVYKTNNPLWYGADIIEILINKGARQEIAFHGYSHKIFDESLMDPRGANIEIQEWLRVGKRKGITPYSVAFPRHQIGHLGVLRDAGMICYRGEPQMRSLYRNKLFGRYLKFTDKLLGLSKIPIFDLTCHEDHGMVMLEPSENLFSINRNIELLLDNINLHKFRIRRIISGVRRAAKEKKIIHLWVHPCEFRTEKDFWKLRQIFLAVSKEVNQDRMRSVGMAEMAKILRKRKAPQ